MTLVHPIRIEGADATFSSYGPYYFQLLSLSTLGVPKEDEKKEDEFLVTVELFRQWQGMP